MSNKIAYCIAIILILILMGATVTAAETNDTDEGNSVYELQVVYPAPLVYVSDFGVGMQGKYYLKPRFYLGWYTPVRMIFPLEQKHMWDSSDTVDSDIQVKLMGTMGYTVEKSYFTFDSSLIAGWRYWYLKTTVNNPTNNINRSYESSTISFEAGLMSTIRWKLGESFKLKDPLNNINMDFYAYWPVTNDFFQNESRSELALGFSYLF